MTKKIRPKALILGDTGFIGRELWRILSASGYDLVGVSSKSVHVNEGQGSGEYTYAYLSELLGILAVHDFDYVYLSANYFTRSSSVSSPVSKTLNYVNSVMPLSIVDCILGSDTFICNLSSFWVLPNHSMRALPYAQSKESLISGLKSRVKQANLVNLYLTETFGPGDRRGKVSQRIVEAKISGTQLEPDTPSAIISLTHIEDLIIGIHENVSARKPGDFLILGPYKLRLVELVHAAHLRPHEFVSTNEFLKENNLILESEIDVIEIQSDRDLETGLSEIEEDLLLTRSDYTSADSRGSQSEG